MKRIAGTFFIILLSLSDYKSQNRSNKLLILQGTVYDKESGKVLDKASVQILNSGFATTTDKNGHFLLVLLRTKHLALKFSHLSYQSTVKECDTDSSSDTLSFRVYMNRKVFSIDSVTIVAHPHPDTVFGSPKFSIQDFEFYENGYLLLSFDKKTDKPYVRLADQSQHILGSVFVPDPIAEVKEFYRDYMGYVNLLCKKNIYRILIRNNAPLLASLPPEDYNALVKPVIDTLKGQLLFSNYSPDFPLFTYFSYYTHDSTHKEITTIENADLMHAYRFEYYSMKPREKLLARNIAAEYGIDKHRAAALISGFTQSMYYEPLYAPLFVIGDTLHVFDHYRDYLFHFNRYGQKTDSVKINYHHPKNWREWKNCMVKDIINNDIYAIYSHNGHQYLKQLNYRSGKEEGMYKIIHHSAGKIKVRDGYIYYIYRPFESLQEKFLYRERIVLR